MAQRMSIRRRCPEGNNAINAWFLVKDVAKTGYRFEMGNKMTKRWIRTRMKKGNQGELRKANDYGQKGWDKNTAFIVGELK